MKELPKYVLLGDDTALRLIKGNKYFRDAGNWSIHVTVIDGKIIGSRNSGALAHVNGQELKECSPQKWAASNAGYT